MSIENRKYPAADTGIDNDFGSVIALNRNGNMDDAKLLELINKAYRELERSREAKASSSLIKVLEEDIRELELIFATSDAERLEKRAFLDQCAEKFDKQY